MYSVFLVALVSFLIVLVVTPRWRNLCGRWGLIGGWGFPAGSLHSKSRPAATVLFIGDESEAAQIVRAMNSDPEVSFAGFLSWQAASDSPLYLGNLADLRKVVREVRPATIVCGCGREQLGQQIRRQLLRHRLAGVPVSDVASFYQARWGITPLRFVDEQWLLWARGFNLLDPFAQRVKRLMDVGCSVLGLILTMPIIVLAAMAVRLDSKGPVLYRQKRVGFGERPFELLKLRSMAAEEGGRSKASWTAVDDLRITRVGRFLRRTHIDELPQFWNVLRGDMSMVGPRPEQVSIARRLKQMTPYYSFRHAVRPGITGWAQVNNGYCGSYQESLRKLEYDLYYVQHMSLFLDLRILCRTVSIILTGKGSR